MKKLRFGRHVVEIGNEDKVLFPDCGLTKGALIDYYVRVAPRALPHLAGRPLTLQRFPDGIRRPGFFQQRASKHFPDWVRRVRAAHAQGGRIEHVACENTATLAYLAGQAAITLHTWLSRARALERPDLLVFDLDPSRKDFGEVRDVARRLRDLLEELGLPSFPKTTGSRGLHVVVPLRAAAGFDAVRGFARDVATLLAARHPEHITVAQRKARRGRRIYLDVQRNAFGQTAVAPYAVRARPGAPVATPLAWSDVDDARLRADRYTVANLFRRLAARGDPWRGLARQARSLGRPQRRLDALRRDAGLRSRR